MPTKSARPSKTRAASGAVGGGSVFDRLDALARNLWWTWNPPARMLFESLDPALWRATNQNPLLTMAHLGETRRRVVESDPGFLARLAAVEKDLSAYLNAKTWYAREAQGPEKKMQVAYFCMEYAVHECLPLYAGGLGVLAGDHVKSASDLGLPFACVGVLWKYGYYRQEIQPEGSVRVLYPESPFDRLPVRDTGKRIVIPIGKSKVKARIWSLTVGRVNVYLLDTDIEGNPPADRRLSHFLYAGGDPEYRVRQEILLGIGGLIALEAVGVEPTVFHLNEGHAAFSPLERVRRLVKEGHGLDEAISLVRSQSVFTTHTPVPEGNDRFEPSLVMKYFPDLPKELGVSKEEFLGMGREDEHDKKEPFCMTVLALKLADHCNGVAALHGDTSRKMWMKTYGAKSAVEVPISHVTNGIHPETWLADEARPFYEKHLKPKWVGAGPTDDWWAKAGKIPAKDLWDLRCMLRRAFVAELRRRLREQAVYHGASTADLIPLYDALDENALTIGFARRFALYKRAPLIFKDAKRLAKIMNDAERPVQLVFSGKAHPMDEAGHAYVRTVTEFCRHPDFKGRVFILQNYDTAIGKLLTQGCDVWLNNPIRPMEASGTSGMKPCLVGGLNCSILDGWWPEAYDTTNGWALGDGTVFKDRAKQDRVDAEAIYSTLEKSVVPMFYDRDKNGIPQEWVKMMKRSMETVGCRFSTHRMVAEYTEHFYWPAHS